MTDNNFWGQKLAEEYEREAGSRRGIRLPARNQIRFDGELHRVTITMEEAAVLANLQTNAAAFEAWSLALKVWCGVETIELRWQPPGENCTETQRCHYQRFLYRAARFHSLFPEWFHLSRPVLPADAEALGVGPFHLNVPGYRVAKGGTANDSAADESIREADLERHLCTSKGFEKHFGLEKVDRQFPVGLFRDSVAKGNRIFTGAKSAIDLVGIGKQGLWLFELKAGENIPAGILSELIFYTSVMRDAIPGPAGQEARFQFKPGKPANGTVVSATDVKSCKRIEAVLLAEHLHPLVGHRRIIRMLNEAAYLHWNKSPDYVPVNFRATVLKRSIAPSYQFNDVDAGLDTAAWLTSD